MQLKYIFITNRPSLARFAEECGITRVMVDLERLGKSERQGHLDTWISSHSLEDIKAIRGVLTDCELMVRINPLHASSAEEVDSVIAAGADIVMQPMIQSTQEVEAIGSMIDGRVKMCPLIETCASLEVCNLIAKLPCVDELHFGLNDLHLEMRLPFMLELYRNGVIAEAVSQLTKPFGIGGVARCNYGLVPGRYVLQEHAFLGSTGVILSREFHGQAENISELSLKLDLKAEIEALTEVYDTALKLPAERRAEVRSDFFGRIAKINAEREL